MLVTVSNKVCTDLDKHSSPTNFTNRLPFVIVTDTTYSIRLIGISIQPWPETPFLVCCNLCEQQPIAQTFANVLSMTYGNEKFSRPRVPARTGRYEEVEIELVSISGEPIVVESVTAQLTIDQN